MRRETMTVRQALKVFGLEGEVTEEIILTQFRKLSLKHHPDKGGRAEQFQEIVRAREVLLANIEVVAHVATPIKVDIDWSQVTAPTFTYDEFIKFYSNFKRTHK